MVDEYATNGGLEIFTDTNSGRICLSQEHPTFFALFQVYKQVYPEKGPYIQAIIKSSIPSGYGLGSSGAISVAFAGAILHSKYGASRDKIDRTRELALISENCFHGKTSGIDVYASLMGGITKIQDGEFKVISSIEAKPPQLVFIGSGISRSTKTQNAIAKTSLMVNTNLTGRIY